MPDDVTPEAQPSAVTNLPAKPSVREVYEANLKDAELPAREAAPIAEDVAADADTPDTPDTPDASASEDDAEVDAAAEAAVEKVTKKSKKAKAAEEAAAAKAAEEAAAAKGDEDAGEDADAEDAAEDSNEDAPEGDGEKTVAEQVLELMKDKKTLAAALDQAGVEDIMELPLVKELLGRERQSAIDTTRAELQRQAFEDTEVTSRLERGRKSVDEFVTEMESLLKAYEEDEDGTAELAFPTAENIRGRFKEVADATVEAYHAQTFADIAEVINALPELAAATPEMRNELAKFAGRPPQEWLGAHLEVARQSLWNIAQNQVAAAAEKRIEDQKTVLEAAHKLEVEKLTEKHERVLAKAVEKARTNARQEAIADAASGKLPPRAPKKEAATEIDEGEITGKSIGDIFKQLKSQAEKSGAI